MKVIKFAGALALAMIWGMMTTEKLEVFAAENGTVGAEQVLVAEIEDSAEGTTKLPSEDEQIEIPDTGVDEPSPLAVGITMGVIVFMAFAGAVALVKRLKRDA